MITTQEPVDTTLPFNAARLKTTVTPRMTIDTEPSTINTTR
jgi:hypothetical protein